MFLRFKEELVVLLTPVKQPHKECKSTVLLEFIISAPLPHFSSYLANIFPEVRKTSEPQVSMSYIATHSKAFYMLATCDAQSNQWATFHTP